MSTSLIVRRECLVFENVLGDVLLFDAFILAHVHSARHVGDRMYRGETYVMQMDAHCQFVNHWDTLLIKQWSQTQNEMAVLRYHLRLILNLMPQLTNLAVSTNYQLYCPLSADSSYLTDVQESISPAGDSLRNSRPIMCNRYVAHDVSYQVHFLCRCAIPLITSLLHCLLSLRCML